MRPIPSLLLAALLLGGCRDVPVVTEPEVTTPVIAYPLDITGGMGPRFQSIRVFRGGVPIMDAHVTINGVPIPYRAPYGSYSTNLPAAARVGDTLNLKVVADSVTFEAAGVVSSIPTITTPSAGRTFAWTDSVVLAWTSAANPDRFEVCINCWESSLYAWAYTALGGDREFIILPQRLVDFGTGTIVTVTAFKSDFIKVASAQVEASVRFVATSEATIKVTY